MEEENKIVEEQPAQQPQPANDPNKFSLITFILSVVGLVVCSGWIIGGIAAIVLGAISLKRLPNSNPNRKPFTIFDKISKPVGIVDIILGVISVVAWTIYLIVVIVAAIAAAAAGAGA